MGRNSKAHTGSGFKHQKRSNYRGFKSQRNQHDFRKHSNLNQGYPQVPKATLREDQVGITEYISPTLEGFTGVIKSRYSDFHVNEIDLDDKVLILDDLNIPKLETDAPLNDTELEEVRGCLKNVIPDQTWEKIQKLAETKSEPATIPIEININELDKDKRTQIHALLKQLYHGKLVSSTITQDIEGALTKFLRIAKPKGKRDEKRQKWTFPGEYVNFLVHKENMDTSEIASHMAQNLGLIASRVNYCGTKDKRAITTQKFCVKRRTPSDIVASIRALRNVKIGNFSFSQKVLKLGELHGNRFRIALRHISAEQSLIERALLQLRENGFINYFGLQRFGNCVDVPTYEIGVALMKADYKKACELILKPRGFDPPFLKEIRDIWWKNRDSKAAAAMFRSDRFIEKKLLDGLARFGENDYSTALRKLPRNLLLLYPHAFQSLVFNRIASRRIKEYKLKILPGDLVYRSNTDMDDDDIEIEDPNDDAEENASGCDEIIKDTIDTPAPDSSIDETQTESEFKQKVRALTEEDIASGKFTIHDIVLPLPGFDIKYPENVLDEWYKEILQEFGLTSETLSHNVKMFNMAGAYRKLAALPLNLTWEFRNYDKDDEQLIWSDWDKLHKKKDVEPTDPSKNEGKKRALLLDFCLQKSSYATMLLRELLKVDTSTSNQTLLEKGAKEEQTQNEVSESTMKAAADVNDSKDDNSKEKEVIADADANVDEALVAEKRGIEKTSAGDTSDETEPAEKISRNL